MTFFIYKITNLKNSKIYIGKTSEPDRRWAAHKRLAASDKKHFYLHNAINKYSIENFSFDIIASYDDENQSYKLEEEYISKFKSNDENYGYNLTVGGRGIITDKPVSLETREKISKAQKGIKRRDNFDISGETRKILGKKSKNNRGLVSIELKKEILYLFDTGEFTKKQLAKKFDLEYETIRYIINYYKKNGFKTKEEKSNNISLAKKGKSLTQEHKNNLSNALTGIVFTEDRKNKISNALKGKSKSQDVKDKIAITLSGRDDYIEIKNKIIELFETGNYTRIELAKMFNFNRKVVEKIIRRHKNEE